MKKQKYLIKIFTPLLVTLFALSFFGAISNPVTGQTITQRDALTPQPPKGPSTQPLDASQTVAAQEKARDIIENMLSVDLSKYTLELQSSSIMDGVPFANDNRKITSLRYALTPLEGSGAEDGVIEIYFTIEKDVVTNYFTMPVASQVITNTQYDNQKLAVKEFLEKYQAHTNIDSSNLITMLDDIDLTKNATMIQENIKCTVKAYSFWGIEQVNLRWTYTVNGADYTSLEIAVNAAGFITYVYDDRALYIIGDTAINISMEQAVDIAIANLGSYSYEMPDGSIVKDFRVNKDATLPKLAVVPVDYELRPYWHISMYLDDVYPGSVFGITAFIWADTGEIISYGNMAIGGVYDTDDNYISDAGSPLSLGNKLAIVIMAIAVVALVIGFVVKRKYK